MKKLFNYSVSVFIAVAMAGCDDDEPKTVDSDHVATGQIYATFQIMSDGGDEVYAEAQLTKDVPPASSDEPETFVQLVRDDELWLSSGPSLDNVDFGDDVFGGLRELDGTQTRFSSTGTEIGFYDFIFFRGIINSIGTWYSADLPQSEEREYHVALLRDNSATDSTIVLPQPFTVVSPMPGESLSRSADDMILEWTNTEVNVSVEIEINTTCTDNEFASFTEMLDSDSGTWTIPAGSLDSAALEGDCSSTVNIRKSRSGELDPRFVGGAVNGYQIRRVVIDSTP